MTFVCTFAVATSRCNNFFLVIVYWDNLLVIASTVGHSYTYLLVEDHCTVCTGILVTGSAVCVG
jgi:hypothetical protein